MRVEAARLVAVDGVEASTAVLAAIREARMPHGPSGNYRAQRYFAAGLDPGDSWVRQPYLPPRRIIVLPLSGHIAPSRSWR